MKIPLTKRGKKRETTTVVNTTVVVKPSGGCRDGFEKADRTRSNPLKSPLIQGGTISSSTWRRNAA